MPSNLWPVRSRSRSERIIIHPIDAERFEFTALVPYRSGLFRRPPIEVALVKIVHKI
jgi:hypothetical protein